MTAPAVTFTSADERNRLVSLVPDPLVRTEVLQWIDDTRSSTDLSELLFRGHVRATVVDGDLKFELTETGRGSVERRRAAKEAMWP